MKFSDLGLSPQILQAAQEAGYREPSPIQQKAIGPVLEGRDLIGCAQTGTGKTAAFAMPILQLLAGRPWKTPGKRPVRALILTPTRELAIQIEENFGSYGRHLPVTHQVIFGGVPQKPQEQALAKGVDILVATPGRLNDLAGQKLLQLSSVEIFVLDEADRMLDMGFLPDVKRVLALLPKKRQTLLFSATMPKEIRELATGMLHNPVQVAVDPVSSTVDRIEQQVYFVDRQNKRKLLADLLADPEIRSALIFTRTKHGADRVARDLKRAGIQAAAIHGDKSQGQRQAALGGMKDGAMRVLVATDIAARGIDIEDLSHVINFDLPNVPETYVHRIGRTGRAGMSGKAVSFCDFEEKAYLADIEKLIGKKLTVMEQHPYPMEVFEVPPKPARSDRFSSARPHSGQPKKPEAASSSETAAPLGKQESAPKQSQRQGRRQLPEQQERRLRQPEAHRDDRPRQTARQQDSRLRQTERQTEKEQPSPAASGGQSAPKGGYGPKAAPLLQKTSPPSSKAASLHTKNAPLQEKRQTVSPISGPEPDSKPVSESGTFKGPGQEDAKSQLMRAENSLLAKGLPTIREDGKKKSRLESREVSSYDDLPKPPAGRLLLNSFADTGVEYRLREDPQVDQHIFETLGFYRPPADAMERIFGKDYRSLPPEEEAPAGNPSEKEPFQPVEEPSPVPETPAPEKQPAPPRDRGPRRPAQQAQPESEKAPKGPQKRERTPYQGKQPSNLPLKQAETQKGKGPENREKEEQSRRRPNGKRKEAGESSGAIKTRSQQLWYADAAVPSLTERKPEAREKRSSSQEK